MAWLSHFCAEMIFLTLLLALTAVLGQQRDSDICGRSCLMSCRTIAIRCVTEGVKPSNTLELMKCVIFKANEDNIDQPGALVQQDYKSLNGEICWNCIEPELEKSSPEERAECLDREGVCRDIQELTDCDAQYDDRGCGWIGGADGACFTIKEKATYADYSRAVELMKTKDDCELVGARWRDGRCKPKPERKIKCGSVSRSKMKKKIASIKGRHQLKNVCEWLPGCSFKDRKMKCHGQKNAGPFGRQKNGGR